MVKKTKNMEAVSKLFEGWEETLIWSCLQDVMGSIFVTEEEEPTCAMAQVGDFCFFAGIPNAELVSFWPKERNAHFVIMVPQNEEWSRLIEENYPQNSKKTERYAIKKEADVFDYDKLQQFVDALDKDYEIKIIDKTVYEQCKQARWSADFIVNYPTYEQYQRLGLGFCIFHHNEIVAGVSSYTSYKEGIEIEIDTREDYRRKGLATICTARLILECRDRKLYPSWDAQNMWSVHLAEKLGYHYSHTYRVYEVTR